MKKLKKTITKKHIKTESMDFNVRKKQYNEMKELRQMLKARKEKFIKEENDKRKKIEENKRRKEENQLKNGTYEIIKNPEKIKKWKVKARKQIRRVPKDIFYNKYFNKE